MTVTEDNYYGGQPPLGQPPQGKAMIVTRDDHIWNNYQREIRCGAVRRKELPRLLQEMASVENNLFWRTSASGDDRCIDNQCNR